MYSSFRGRLAGNANNSKKREAEESHIAVVPYAVSPVGFTFRRTGVNVSSLTFCACYVFCACGVAEGILFCLSFFYFGSIFPHPHPRGLNTLYKYFIRERMGYVLAPHGSVPRLLSL